MDGNLRVTYLIDEGVGYLVVYLEGGTAKTAQFTAELCRTVKTHYDQASSQTGVVVHSRVRKRLAVETGHRPSYIRVPQPQQGYARVLRNLVEAHQGQWLSWQHPVQRLV